MSEARIRAGLSELDALTVAAKERVEKTCYDALKPSDPRFFDVVSFKDGSGREMKMFRGFFVAAGRAFRRERKTMMGAVKSGAKFANGIQGQIREGAPQDEPSA